MNFIVFACKEKGIASNVLANYSSQPTAQGGG